MKHQLHAGGLPELIGRRDLFALLGGAAAAWPQIVRAQQRGKLPRIGVLMFGAPDGRGTNELLATFESTLLGLGWQDRVSVVLDVRWAAGQSEGFHRGAEELMTLNPDVALATASPAVVALRNLTRTTPIVFANVTDPVGQGFVESLAHPGGNVTGFTNYEPAMSGKWLGLLKEIAADVTRVAVLFNPQVAPQAPFYLASLNAAAPTLGIAIVTAPVRDDAEIEMATAAFAATPDGGLLVLADLFTALHAKPIVEAAARHRLPAAYPYDLFTSVGGLLAYGISNMDAFRGAASYVDRILKGASPSELPVQEPTKFTLALNLKTAKTLGLTIPITLLATADQVIE